MALINNKLLEEADQDADPDNENDLPDFYNDPGDCKKHPDYKTNLCRVCYKHNTVYICERRKESRGERSTRRGDSCTSAVTGGALTSTTAAMYRSVVPKSRCKRIGRVIISLIEAAPLSFPCSPVIFKCSFHANTNYCSICQKFTPECPC